MGGIGITLGVSCSIAAAMVLIRLGWSGRRGAAAVGWATIAAALTALTAQDGAWGLAIGIVVAITDALALVLQAGWATPGRAHKPPRQVASLTLPRRRSDVVRRVAVFALVVPVGFAAAQWLAFGVQAVARRAGAGEADAIALALFLQPILWGCLMAWQMTRPGVARMVTPVASAAALGTLLWSAA